MFFFFFFFFQAEDGIRDLYVTGVQTCALPISLVPRRIHSRPPCRADRRWLPSAPAPHRRAHAVLHAGELLPRSSAPYALPQVPAEAGTAMRPVRQRRSGVARCSLGRLRRSPRRRRRARYPAPRPLQALGPPRRGVAERGVPAPGPLERPPAGR